MYVFLIHHGIHLLYQKEYMRYGGSSIWSPFTCSTKHLGFSQAIIDFSLSWSVPSFGLRWQSEEPEAGTIPGKWPEGWKHFGKKHFNISLGEVFEVVGPTTCWCFVFTETPLIDCMAKKLHPRLALYNISYMTRRCFSLKTRMEFPFPSGMIFTAWDLLDRRQVLRFHCFWDDMTKYGTRMCPIVTIVTRSCQKAGNQKYGISCKPFGDHKTLAILRYYTLHYYLADDTAEILENMSRPDKLPRRSKGRGILSTSCFLKQRTILWHQIFVASSLCLDVSSGSAIERWIWKTALFKLVGRLLPTHPGN